MKNKKRIAFVQKCDIPPKIVNHMSFIQLKNMMINRHQVVEIS
jgi:hypothetical protein